MSLKSIRMRVPGDQRRAAPPSVSRRQERRGRRASATRPPAARQRRHEEECEAGEQRVARDVGGLHGRRDAESRRRVPRVASPAMESIRRRSSRSIGSRTGWRARRPPVIVDVRWYLGRPGDGHGPRTSRGTCPARSSSTSTRTWPTRTGSGAPGRHPLPSPGRVRRADGRRRDRRRRRASSATTTSVAGSPRGCGGCSTTSASAGAGIDGEWVGVLDGGIKAWAEAGEPLDARRSRRRAPAAG